MRIAAPARGTSGSLALAVSCRAGSPHRRSQGERRRGRARAPRHTSRRERRAAGWHDRTALGRRSRCDRDRQLLIRAGANVKATNRYGATPLWLASLNGNAATIGMLLEAGADPSAASDEGETALMVAARTGKVDAVNLLLARGADPNVARTVARSDRADVGRGRRARPGHRGARGARRRRRRAVERRIHARCCSRLAKAGSRRSKR